MTIHNGNLSKIGGEFTRQTNSELQNHQTLRDLNFEIFPFFGTQWNLHQTIFLKRQSLSRLLYLDHLYKKIVDVPGVICEFGVHWGATLVQLINLRGIYEPFNYSRTIYGFDTFEGFPDIHENDGSEVEIGDYSVQPWHFEKLKQIIEIQESFSPISHIEKTKLIKGDATLTIDTWLEENPSAIISAVFFDMDIYKPTKVVLQKILPRLTKGSLIVFDELNCPNFPGETIALQEILGIDNIRLKRDPNQPYCAWFIWGD